MKAHFFCLCVLFAGLSAQSQAIKRKQVFVEAEGQLKVLLQEARAQRVGQATFPRTVVHDSVKLVNSGDWTSGFFPGLLWFMYEQTKKQEWLQAAKEFTALMHKEPYNRNSHDVGFKVYDSYGNGYRLTRDSSYKRLLIDAARTLASRFNPKVGCIRSWDFGKWQYPVIIDNMMNLELLFEASRLSGDASFRNIAISHANTTMANHFRPDYSSYHVVSYDTLTGKPLSKGTHQGYGDESSWARGQAWALYGYTMCYRETKDKNYLAQAEKVANYILNNSTTPADGVPYWDYSVPDVNKESRDASAAAITASALLELADYSKQGAVFKNAADKILKSLTAHYRALLGFNHGFILLHSTGHKPVDSEVDVPLIYADYYYLEALMRLKKDVK